MGLLHKSDVGGVVLGLADEPSAVTAYRDLVRRLDPPAVSVEQMAERDHGVEPVDIDAIADLAARVSVVAAEHPELGELEINPVLCSSSGALALDARVVLRR
jgi:acyl-CoA synthetase (NDP forming)